MRKNPPRIFRKRTEADLQMAIADYVRIKYPKVLWTISPSGMKLPVSVAVKFKRMGYRAGTPDINFDEPRKDYHGLKIELKLNSKCRATKEQIKYINAANQRGYYAVVCYGYDDAINTIDWYFENLPCPIRAEHSDMKD